MGTAAQTSAQEPVIDRLAEVWASTTEACQGLGEPAWGRPTACPGWSVRDQVSHLIGTERMLLGEKAPDALIEDPPHVRNQIGSINEAWIEARRAVPGAEVAAEFVLITERRLDELRSMPTAKFDEIGWSPVGQVPYRQFMDVRVFDSWAHEQDIRRAVDRPGGRNGAGEAVVLDQCTAAMPYVVGKKVGLPDGASVLFVVTGVLGRRVPIVVSGGRAVVGDTEPDRLTAVLTMDQQAFWSLGLGRVTASHELDRQAVALGGDAQVGRAVLEAMAFVI